MFDRQSTSEYIFTQLGGASTNHVHQLGGGGVRKISTYIHMGEGGVSDIVNMNQFPQEELCRNFFKGKHRIYFEIKYKY